MKDPSNKREPDKARNVEGFFFSTVCICYFLLFAPEVAETASSAMKDPDASPVWLGVVLIVLNLLEVYAFPVKVQTVRQVIRDQGGKAKGSGGAIFVRMFHAVLSVIVVFTAAGAFGLKIGEGEGETMELPWWMSLIIVTTVIKELAFLMCILGVSEEDGGKKSTRSMAKERFVDFILLAYSCIGFTAVWGAITTDMEMQRQVPVMYVINLILACLMFLIFYLPFRIPYLMEERALIKGTRDEARFWILILVVMIPAVWVLR